MWRVSKSADPDQTRRRRRCGWSRSTLFRYVRRSLFAWRWPFDKNDNYALWKENICMLQTSAWMVSVLRLLLHFWIPNVFLRFPSNTCVYLRIFSTKAKEIQQKYGVGRVDVPWVAIVTVTPKLLHWFFFSFLLKYSKYTNLTLCQSNEMTLTTFRAVVRELNEQPSYI